jgi:hypothetical protein
MSNQPDIPRPPAAETPFPEHIETEPVIVPVEAPGVQVTVADAVAHAPEPAPVVVTRQRSHAWWACGSVFITLIAAATFLTYNFAPSPRALQDAATRGASTVYKDLSAAVAASRPKVEMKTVIDSAVGQLNTRGKLVVLTRTLSVDVKKSSTKTLWDTFKLEDSAVRLKVNNNSVQYVVPLDALTPEQFAYEEASNTLIVTLPEPRLDREMVVVSSNPDDWEVETSISWTRIQDWWGEQLLKEARANLRGLVVQAGQETLILKEAREAAFLQLNQLIQNLVGPLAPGVQIELRFDPTLSPAPGAEGWRGDSPAVS